MRWLLVVLALLFVSLQYRLWFGEGSLAQKIELERAVVEQQRANAGAAARNAALAREVTALKQGLEAVEERARNDLGMIKDGETFYMVIEEEDETEPPENGS